MKPKKRKTRDSWMKLGLDLEASAFKVTDPGFWTMGSITLDRLIHRARALRAAVRKEGKK